MDNKNRKVLDEFANAAGDSRQVGEQVFNKLRGKFENVTLGDAEANATQKPEEAVFFNFDYTVQGENYGNVTISIIDDAMKVYYSKNISDELQGEDLRYWYSFLQEMRKVAMVNMLRYDVHDISKSRLSLNDIQSAAVRNDGVVESKMYGSNKSSYQKQGPAKIIVRHTSAINPDKRGARSRQVESIFVETHEGERFKMPFKSVPGARAMSNHVSNGGRPYDDIGESISTMVYETAALRPFISKNRNKVYEDETSTAMYEAAKKHYMESRKAIKQLGQKRGYKKYVETFTPAGEENNDDYDVGSYKGRFDGKRDNERLESAYPIVHKAYVKETKPLQEDDINEVIDYGYWDWTTEQFESLARAAQKFMTDRGVNLETGDGYEEFFTPQVIAQAGDAALEILEDLVQGPYYDTASRVKANANHQKQADGITDLIDFIGFDSSMAEALGIAENGHFDDMPGSTSDFNRDFGGGFGDEEPANDFERHERNSERQGEINDFMRGGMEDEVAFGPVDAARQLKRDRVTPSDEFEEWAESITEIEFGGPPFAKGQVAGTGFKSDAVAMQKAMGISDEEMSTIINIAQGEADIDDHYDLYEKLYGYYQDEMPYGTQKARDGDPTQWILDKIETELGGSVDIKVQEDTWAWPESNVQKTELKELLANPLPFGVDGENAASAIYHLLGDDELADELAAGAKQYGPEADSRKIIMQFYNNRATDRNNPQQSNTDRTGQAHGIQEAPSAGGPNFEKMTKDELTSWIGRHRTSHENGPRTQRRLWAERIKKATAIAAKRKMTVEADVAEDMIGDKKKDKSLSPPEKKATYTDYKDAFDKTKNAEEMVEHLTAEGKTADIKIAEATCKRMAVKDNSGLQVNEADLDILRLAGIVSEGSNRGNRYSGDLVIELYDPKSEIESEAHIEATWTYDDGNVGFGTGPGRSPYPDGTWDYDDAVFTKPLRFRGQAFQRGDPFYTEDFEGFIQNEEVLDEPVVDDTYGY